MNRATINKPEQAAPPLQSLIGHQTLLRDQKVKLDAALAELYGVPAKALVQAVKRNLIRFPTDFMLQLTAEEFSALRSQAVTSNSGRGGRRTAPYAFTQQVVAVLSSVLSSTRAISVNLEIMRTFVRVREFAETHSDLAKRFGELEEETGLLSMQHDTFCRNMRNQLKQVFDALRELMAPTSPPPRPIGFTVDIGNPRQA